MSSALKIFFRISFLLIMIVVFDNALAQTTFDPEKRQKSVIRVPQFDYNKQKLPFNAVVVTDMRYDTSKLGYSDDKIAKRIVTAVPFETAINLSLANSLQSHLYTNSNYKVHLFITHFWLDGLPEKNIPQTFCKAQVEAFMESDSFYYPLFRFDTTIISPKKSTSVANLILIPFQSCLAKISGVLPDSIIRTTKKQDFEKILAWYQNKKQYPQLMKDNREKGVYLTYQDFLLNKTIYPVLRYEQTLYTDDLYVTVNGQETLIKDFWGFSDGTKQFVRLGQNFYELHRQNQSFELHGPSSIDLLRKKDTKYIPVLGNGLIYSGVSAIPYEKGDKLLFKPMQLNMETGKPYGL